MDSIISPNFQRTIVSVTLLSTSVVFWNFFRSKQNKINFYDAHSDDDCNSLFYDTSIIESGFPSCKTISKEVVTRLTKVHSENIKLPKQLYGDIVASMPTVCVDVICQRYEDKKLLLFLRRDKPAAGIWWWPGGRMFKGETFFETAERKIRDETGQHDLKIHCKEIITVWNTFFPDSSWDEGRNPGKEGCQTVNITVFCEVYGFGGHGSHANLEALKDWAVGDQKWVTVDETLRHGSYDKYIRLNVEIARTRKLL
jgi:hypothetical protein